MDNNPIKLDDPKGDCPPCVVELVEGTGAAASSLILGTTATNGSSDGTMGPGEAMVAATGAFFAGAWHGMAKAWNMIHPTAPSAPTATAHPGTPSAPTATAPPGTQTTTQAKEHTSGARKSTLQKHQEGQARGAKQREGYNGMKNPPRKRPDGWKGPWPPKNPAPPPPPTPPPAEPPPQTPPATPPPNQNPPAGQGQQN